VPAERIEPELGQAAEALSSVGLLAGTLRREGMRAPAVEGLAALVEGRIAPDEWAAGVTRPRERRRAAA